MILSPDQANQDFVVAVRACQELTYPIVNNKFASGIVGSAQDHNCRLYQGKGTGRSADNLPVTTEHPKQGLVSDDHLCGDPENHIRPR
jgi:hypothetical protein